MSRSRPSPADPSLDIVAGVDDDLLDDLDPLGRRAEGPGEPGPKDGPEKAGLDDGTDAEPEPDAVPNTDAGTEPDIVASTEPDADAPDTDAPDADAPDTDAPDDGTVPDVEPYAEPDAGTEPEAASDTDTDADPEEAAPGFVRNLLEWAAILGGALVVALVVTKFLIQAFFIPSGSMLPTLNLDDRVLVNKLSYDLHEVNRGDLVVFERPASEGDSDIKDLIKRVVALSGETVESREGRLFVNGEPLDEPYLPSGVETSGVDLQTIPPGHIFVMGDNRGDSRDSRFFGPLPEELIIGRAFVKVWPLLDIGLL